jgi:hypothetical protein
MAERFTVSSIHPIEDDAARGGVTGHGVRYVLAIGLLLTVCAFLAIPIFV